MIIGKMKYDPIKHAKDLIFNGGGCSGADGCDVCFAIKCRDNCYPDAAYAAAKKYLEEHGEQDGCVSIW